MNNRLAQIGHEIKTQNNRITAEPIFVVQTERKMWGVGSDHGYDGYEWYLRGSGDYSVKDGPIYDWLEAECDEWNDEVDAPDEPPVGFDTDGYGWAPGLWTKVYFKIIWEFATCCFTEHGCKEYMKINGHNLKNPRIYVYSGNRNQEWIDLRLFLKTIREPE